MPTGPDGAPAWEGRQPVAAVTRQPRPTRSLCHGRITGPAFARAHSYRARGTTRTACSGRRLTSGVAEFVAHEPDPVTGLQRVPARRRSWPRRASARMRGGSSTAGRQRRLQHRRRPYPGGRARGGAGRGARHHERQRVRKHRAGARASSKSREPTSAMAVNESGLGSSADGKGEEGIDRSFDRAAAPVHLGE